MAYRGNWWRSLQRIKDWGNSGHGNIQLCEHWVWRSCGRCKKTIREGTIRGVPDWRSLSRREAESRIQRGRQGIQEFIEWLVVLIVIYHILNQLPALMIPWSTNTGISAASQGPRAVAKEWAIPSFGEYFCQRGAKCMSRQILPPLYILCVFPSSSGSSISMGAAGYVAGISKFNSNSYFTYSWMYQHFPCHLYHFSQITSNLLSAISVRLDIEPIMVILLIHLNVLNEEHVLLLESLNPSLPIFGTRVGLDEG